MKTDNELINLLLERGNIKEPDLLKLYITVKYKSSVKGFNVAISDLLTKGIVDYILVSTKFGIEKIFFLSTKVRLNISKKFKIVI